LIGHFLFLLATYNLQVPSHDACRRSLNCIQGPFFVFLFFFLASIVYIALIQLLLFFLGSDCLCLVSGIPCL
jgi:hypothetical protein